MFGFKKRRTSTLSSTKQETSRKHIHIPAWIIFCWSGFKSVSRKLDKAVIMWMFFGIILMVTASFVPEFPTDYPILYQFGTAGVRVAEFICKAIFGLISSILNLKLGTYFTQIFSDLDEMIAQFFNWVKAI